ncbi:MAG: hypothetical protein IKB11_09040 [Bacteroidaceae bacterium]|nr:hypothetical protein [Bacteroidaceae bacterium]MBR3829942.1 hypothetical protein [Muribaculaceae bacterium]
MKKLGFGAIFMALAVGGIIVLAGCKKEKTDVLSGTNKTTDVLSGTTWTEVWVVDMLYPTQQPIELVFDNDGNMSIGNLFVNIPYTVDNNVMSLSLPSGDTYQHRFIIDDDEQMLKILDNFHYYSLTQDIWDTVYYKKVN